MNKKLKDGLAIILPNKRINLFVIFVLVLGIISGSIFLMTIKDNDKSLVIEQINNFIMDISNNKIDNFMAFKNAICENYIFIFLIWILGMSMIGVVVNIFLVYFKGFIYGFTLSSFYIVFGYKGLLLSLIYVCPTIIINFIIAMILGVYSILFTSYLWKVIFSHDRNTGVKRFIKKYLVILCFVLVLGFISSICESYLIPAMIKVVIKVFI